MKNVTSLPPELFQKIIDKMFEIAGQPVTFQQLQEGEKDWFVKYSMTEEQNREWRAWGVEELTRHTKSYKKTAVRTMQAINEIYGLRPPLK